MRLGENIKAYREKAGLSLRALAEEVGVTYSTISRYENGKATPRYDTLKQIARALGVDSVYYLYGDEDKDEYDRMMAEQQEQISLAKLELYARQLAALQKKEGLLLQAFYELNEEGQQKTVEYTEDLVASGKYAK